MRLLLSLFVVGAFLFSANVQAGEEAEKKEPVQFAIVGCAHIHVPSYTQLLNYRKDVKVKYVWDHDVARAKKAAEAAGAAVVDDVAKIWKDPDIKAVVILSETVRHEELVIAAAKAKKHMFVEKPLALGARDAYAMMQAVEEAGVLFQMGYTRRGEGRTQFIQEQIKNGTLGKVTRIRASTSHGGATEGMFDKDFKWNVDPEQAGVGGFGDIGTHALDMLILMMGEVDSVTAVLTPGTGRYPNVDQVGEGLIRFKNGVIGTVGGSWADDKENLINFGIWGTEGHAWFVHDYVYLRSKKVEKATGRRPQGKLPKSWDNVMFMFIDAVMGKPDLPLVTIREAAYCSAVMEAMYQGAKEKKWVTPQAPPAKK
jgi:predicted dehydrogenase